MIGADTVYLRERVQRLEVENAALNEALAELLKLYPVQRRPLTRKQREILVFVTAGIERNGYAPSFQEIADEFGYTSLATVHEHLTGLEKRGWIVRRKNESRSIALTTVMG